MGSWADDMAAASLRALKSKGEPLTVCVPEVEIHWGVRMNSPNGDSINWYDGGSAEHDARRSFAYHLALTAESGTFDLVRRRIIYGPTEVAE